VACFHLLSRSAAKAAHKVGGGSWHAPLGSTPETLDDPQNNTSWSVNMSPTAQRYPVTLCSKSSRHSGLLTQWLSDCMHLSSRMVQYARRVQLPSALCPQLDHSTLDYTLLIHPPALSIKPLRMPISMVQATAILVCADDTAC
jgi:hypothetical protein